VDLLGEYVVSVTFNISNLTSFDVGDDSSMNPFEERANDVIQATPRSLLEVLVGLVIRLKVKRFKEASNGFLQNIWVKLDFNKILNNE
jgi:hypothetical protein